MSKTALLKILLFLLLTNFISGQFFREEFEIRHRRSRLIRHRRNHKGKEAFTNENKHPLDTKQFITETSTLYDDNITTITTMDEQIIVKLEEKSNDINITMNATLRSDNSIDKTFVYFKENTINAYDSLQAINESDSDGLYLREADDLTNTTQKETKKANNQHFDIVTHFLRIVESQHLLGDNCTAGTNLSLGEGVVDRYAQERFRVEADVAVNRANMLTRLWKYGDPAVVDSEYFLYASVFSMVEFDDVIFAAGNCYDHNQYKDYGLFCPYAYRLPEGPILVKDLAVEYKYLSHADEWFYIARKNAENVIRNQKQFSKGYTTYRFNTTAHNQRIPEEILEVRYEDGKWSKPYYDCGGGNIWMLTYTVPFFGYKDKSYFFKGTSGIDIDLRRVDIDQCPLPKGGTQLNIFAASDKCKKDTTMCVPIPGLGFRRGSYKCVCKRGFYFPHVKAERRYYNGTEIEEEYEKQMLGDPSQYEKKGVFECLPCPEGCEACENDRPCVVSLNWVLRTVILLLTCAIILCLPMLVLFTIKYRNVRIVRAASPVLLRMIALGALFIYTTILVMYSIPNIYTCSARVWLREIGFALTYGALMLKTWRISVIFRVRSAKAIKITDMNLLKRLCVIVAVFTAFLSVRTLVAPPVVIVGRTADDLKAYLCSTDWWDHLFSTLEVLFLVWGIRLCIVVRKAPSEFNESRFISMAIYNEFLVSVFLNILMLFLQKPANPDLMYIIFFCHTQLTVTLLLCLTFGSKIIMVLKNKGKDKEEGSSMVSKTPSKFKTKARSDMSHYTSTNSSLATDNLCSKYSERDIQEEFLRLYTQLEILKERNMRMGNRHIASKIIAMQDAARTYDNEETSIVIKSNSSICASIEKSAEVTNDPNEESSTVKIKRQSVSFAVESKSNGENVTAASSATNVLAIKENGENDSPKKQVETESLTYPSNEKKPTASDSNGRHLMSGHARTHSIVINLDDKSRFTDEITV